MAVTHNIGVTDRIVRGLVGMLMIAGVMAGLFVSTHGVAVGVIGMVLLLTAAGRFCPLYRLLGVRTCPHRQRAGEATGLG
jgi:hypothetical protein